MDPVLAARLAKQLEKCRSGASAVEQVVSAADKLTRLEPTLAKRLSEQREKASRGQPVAEVQRPSHEATSQMDPVLAVRLAKQQSKCETGRSDVERVAETQRPGHEVTSRMDPVLAMRFAKQQSKLQTGRSDVERVGSAAEKTVQMDPVLAMRLAKQQRKLETGASEVENVGSRAEHSVQVDPALALRLARQRDKAESGRSNIENWLTSAAAANRQPPSAGAAFAVSEPTLAKRLAEQREKLATGRSAVEHVGSLAAHSERVEDAQLAQVLARRRTLAERTAEDARVEADSLLEGVAEEASPAASPLASPREDADVLPADGPADELAQPLHAEIAESEASAEVAAPPLESPSVIYSPPVDNSRAERIAAAAREQAAFPVIYRPPADEPLQDFGGTAVAYEPAPYSDVAVVHAWESAARGCELPSDLLECAPALDLREPAASRAEQLVEDYPHCVCTPLASEVIYSPPVPMEAHLLSPPVPLEVPGDHLRHQGASPQRRARPSPSAATPPVQRRAAAERQPLPSPREGAAQRRPRTAGADAAAPRGGGGGGSTPQRGAPGSPGRQRLARPATARPAAAAPVPRVPIHRVGGAAEASRRTAMSPVRSGSASPAPPRGAAAKGRGAIPEGLRAGGSPGRPASPRAREQHASPRARAAAAPGQGGASGPSQRRPYGGARVPGVASQFPSQSVPSPARGHGVGAADHALEAQGSVREEILEDPHSGMDLSCVTGKAPSFIMKELQRAAAALHITSRKTSTSVLRCERAPVRFEVEISRYANAPVQHLLRCRRLAGGFNAYKELCSRVLAETRL